MTGFFLARPPGCGEKPAARPAFKFLRSSGSHDDACDPPRAICHAVAATPTSSPGRRRARRLCPFTEPLCLSACSSTLPSAPVAPSAAPVAVQFTAGVSGPRSLRSDAAPPRSRDRPTSPDAAGRRVCSATHPGFWPRDCRCNAESPIGLSVTAEWPPRVIIPVAGTITPIAAPRGSRSASPISPPASRGHHATDGLSHIIPDGLSRTRAEATNRNDSLRSCARHADAEAARLRFSRRRIHRSLR